MPNSVNVYIMRHAQAEPGDRMDSERKLTDHGKEETKQMIGFIKRNVYPPDAVISSNFKRAVDTATPIAKEYDLKVQESPDLDPDEDPEDAWNTIKKLKASESTLLVVTHHPLVNKLTSYLLTGDAETKYNYKHASITYLEVRENKAKLCWFVTPQLIGNEQKSLSEVSLALNNLCL